MEEAHTLSGRRPRGEFRIVSISAEDCQEITPPTLSEDWKYNYTITAELISGEKITFIVQIRSEERAKTNSQFLWQAMEEAKQALREHGYDPIEDWADVALCMKSIKAQWKRKATVLKRRAALGCFT